MTEAVKGRRGRPAGGAQARATRRRIIDAAAELFAAGGYTTTTLEEIATRAGVAVQTVYFHFGNKRTVLKQAVDVAAVGDDEPVALLDRPVYQEMSHETDPRRLIALWAGLAREIMVRIAPIMGVVRDAAGADQDMAEQWRTNQEQRATAFALLSEQLSGLGALPPGMPVERATDVLLAVASIEVYLILLARGWTPAEWEEWVTKTLCDALLVGPPAPDGRGAARDLRG